MALKLAVAFLFFALGALSYTRHAMTQNPVFNDQININQADLLSGKYPLDQVIEAGGQFWTTMTGDYTHLSPEAMEKAMELVADYSRERIFSLTAKSRQAG